jgi:hypothetical protein
VKEKEIFLLLIGGMPVLKEETLHLHCGHRIGHGFLKWSRLREYERGRSNSNQCVAWINGVSVKVSIEMKEHPVMKVVRLSLGGQSELKSIEWKEEERVRKRRRGSTEWQREKKRGRKRVRERHKERQRDRDREREKAPARWQNNHSNESLEIFNLGERKTFILSFRENMKKMCPIDVEVISPL